MISSSTTRGAKLRATALLPPSRHSRFTTSLLVTTSVAALLLAAPAKAGQTITNQTVATVTNPAGNATTSIVITGSTVTGAVANAGTISPGTLVGAGTAALCGDQQHDRRRDHEYGHDHRQRGEQ